MKYFSTQYLFQNTLYFIEHTNLFQVVKNFLRIHISEQWVQRFAFKIFLTASKSVQSIKTVIALHATKTGSSSFFQKKGMHEIGMTNM